MRKLLLILSAIAIGLFSKSMAQTCSGTVSNGQNLITNGDFSQGYTGWSHDPAYIQYTPCANCYSVPGNIYVGTTPTDFNHAFTNFSSHNAASANFLMIDGVCQLGINLWSQSNIPITPNTNYYFSVWITSLDNFAPYGTLQFSINGTVLGPVIAAPGVPGEWIPFTAVWNSGLTPPATATISIQNTTTTGCNTSVDFAIDDLSFTPGCNFGSPGPLPGLGPDFTICGKSLPFNINPGFNAATIARPDITYTWYVNGVQVISGMGPSFYNFSVDAPGTYAVCVDSAGSCSKTSIVNISNTYTVNLGPNLTLCDPITATLNAGYNGIGVTYQWFDNGKPLLGANSETYKVNEPGVYSVNVTDPSCGTKTASVDITTSAATPVNGTFCLVPNGGTGIANLSIVGSGKYKWWTAPIGGTAVAKGNTYTTPVLTGVGPYTYYVEDTSTFVATIGPSATTNDFTNVQNTTYGDTANILIFNALTAFVLDSITVLPYNYYCPNPTSGNKNVINFVVTDSAGNVVGTSNYTTDCNGEGKPAPPIEVPVGISIPKGNGYTIRLGPGSTQIAYFQNTQTTNGTQPIPQLYQYPTAYDPAVEFIANSPSFNVYNFPDAFPGYFSWVITHGVPCDRVPVIATEYCVSCKSATSADSAKVNFPTYCVGSTANITITTYGGAGDTLAIYTDSCGGHRVASSGGANNIVISAPAVATTYYIRWETSKDNCYSSCVSVSVHPSAVPTPSVAGRDTSLCNSATVNLKGNVPVAGTGLWTVVSGIGTIVNPNSATSAVTGLGVGSLVLKWTISNSPCKDTSTLVTIRTDTLTGLALVGSSFNPCNSVSKLTYIASPYNSNATYNWTTGTTGSLKLISGGKSDTATVSIGTLADTIKVTAKVGACSFSSSQLISPVSSPTPSVAGKDTGTCNSVSFNLYANTPIVGTGTWTVVSGTGTIVNPNNCRYRLRNGLPGAKMDN